MIPSSWATVTLLERQYQRAMEMSVFIFGKIRMLLQLLHDPGYHTSLCLGTARISRLSIL